jgi:hypothetical protein
MKHPARSRFARTAFLGFLIIAAAIAAMASFTMFVTGTVLDSIWTTKEHTYHQLLQHKLPVGLGFAALAVILALAATGWTRRKRWGWRLPATSRPPGSSHWRGNPHLAAHPNSKVVLHLTNPTTPEWGAGCIRRSAQYQRNRHIE